MIGRILDKLFSVEQIVFTYGEFMKQILRLGMGRPLEFDEPSYAMGKREWYKEINQALVKVIESFRFKIHPLIIPIINMNLLDRTIRTHLVQWMVHMGKRSNDRSLGYVYRIISKQHQEGYYRYHLCDLIYRMQDIELCPRETCLDCSKLDRDTNMCEIFRARYERKKRDVQDKRYMDSLQKFSEKEARELSDRDIEQLILDVIPTVLNDREDGPDPTKIRIVLEDKWNITIGRNRSYKISKGLKMRYPGRFSKVVEEAQDLSLPT